MRSMLLALLMECIFFAGLVSAPIAYVGYKLTEAFEKIDYVPHIEE